MTEQFLRDSERARTLFEKFHNRAPKGLELASLNTPEPLPLLQVGECWAISYVVRGQPKPFFHKFSTRHRPLLYVSFDGRSGFILKGRWGFTSRGFTG